MKKTTANHTAICLFFCIFFSGLSAFAGNTRLHISTDKETYYAAEKLQFQVLMLNPPASINNTLFVELLDCYGNRLEQQMLPFNFNICGGQFLIPETGKSEFYLLYCYVNNGDSVESSSVKKVLIKNHHAVSQKKISGKINVSSFFEGGTLVAESPNNVLIQCTDENKNPVVAKGKITDGKSAIYAVFATNELGFAKVVLNAEAKVQYHIEIKDKSDNPGHAILPLAAPAGITLNTVVNESHITYSLISYTPIGDKIPEYRIEAIYMDSLIYDATISFQHGLSAVKEELDRESLPAGFITFRLVDKTNKVYAKRVLYNPGGAYKNNFISVIDTVNKREAKVILPEAANGKAYIQIRAADSSSFFKNDPDFLEVTGRFPVNDQLIAAETDPGSFKLPGNQANRYLSLNAVLLNTEKKPLKNKRVNIVLLHKDLQKQYITAQTDNEGRFFINNLVFFDTVTVYYQLADKSEDKNSVVLNVKIMPSRENAHHPPPADDLLCGSLPNNTGDSKTKIDTKELQLVTLTAGKEKTDSEKYADKYISGQMKRTEGTRNEFDFIKNPEEVDNRPLFDFIKGRMPGLKIFDNPDGTPAMRGTNGGTVGIYLNDMEIPESNLGVLANMLIRDVALIKYHAISLKPKTDLRNELLDIRGGDGGDLLIYTRQDFSSSEEKTKGLQKTVAVGYHIDKADGFLHSVSSDESLFWKAGCNVEGGQRIYVHIPAGDTDKDFEIMLEGINVFGAPYHFAQKLVFK